MDTKQKYNAVFNVAKTVMEQKVLYTNGYQFVQNKLSDPSVIKAFESLEKQLNKQLDKLRKEYNNVRKP